MRKNYKRSAATVIAALFLGNIIPEINGMQGLQPNPLANEQIAILESGKEIRVNYQDPDSVLNALRMAVEENDIPSVRGLLNLGRFDDPEVLEKDIKRIDSGIENDVTVETKRKLRFSKRRNEFDEIIFSAMKRDKKAETLLEDQLSVEKQILWILDSATEYNSAELYMKCYKILNECAMLNFSRVETYRRTITYGVDVHDDYDFLKKKYSPKNILDRITPETEYGRKLKKDLLRELSFTLSQDDTSSSSAVSSSLGN